MISGVQILGILFGVLMVYLSFLHYKRREFNRFSFLVWESVWMLFLFVTLFPKTIGGFTQELGFVRLMDFLTITAFMLITVLIFHNYMALSKIKRSLEREIRKEALKDLNKEKNR